MFENTPSDRMQLRGLGELPQPGSCYVCGNGTHEGGYVDFNAFVEYHGAMLMCSTCIKQAAELVGCTVPEELELVLENAQKAASEIERLNSEMEELRAERDALRTVAASSLSVPGDSSVGPDALAAVVATFTERDPDDTTSGTASDEPEPAEPAKKSRRGNSNGNESGNAPKGKATIQL